MPLDATKRCSRCKQDKSTEEFYRNNAAPDDLNYVCKACIRLRRMERGPFLEVATDRRCPGCGETKVASEFYKDPYKQGGLQTYCKPCVSTRRSRRLPDAEKQSRKELRHEKLRRAREEARLRTEKKCPKCGETKSVAEFWKNNLRTDGLAPYCKTCFYAHYGKRHASSPEVRLRANRRRRERIFGIDEAKQLAKQKGLCAACQSPLPPPGHGRHTDHDHVTGKFRGIVCRACNTAAGMLKDDPARLIMLALYLLRGGAAEETS